MEIERERSKKKPNNRLIDTNPRAEHRSKLWILTGALSGFFFGLSNMFMGITPNDQVYSQEVISVGALIVGVGYWLYICIQRKQTRGYYFKWEESYYYDPYDGINWLNVTLAIFMTILLFFTGVLMLLTFSYALYSNLNQGVVSTLFAITSIYLAILFWIIYRQVMNIYDFIGMIALIVCAILLVFSDDRSYIGIDYYSPAWSVLFGILWTILFLIKAVTLKFSYEKLGIDVVDLVLTGFSIAGVICLIIMITRIIDEGITWSFFINNILAGIFECIGNILVSHAVVHGIAGPASALANLQVVVQVILDIVFLSQIPNAMQILACIIGLFGAIIIPFGPVIREKLSG